MSQVIPIERSFDIHICIISRQNSSALIRVTDMINPAVTTAQAKVHILDYAAEKTKTTREPNKYVREMKQDFSLGAAYNYLIDHLLKAKLKAKDIVIFVDDEAVVGRHSWLFTLAGPVIRGIADLQAIIGVQWSANGYLIPAMHFSAARVPLLNLSAFRGDLLLDGCRMDDVYTSLAWLSADFSQQAQAKGYRCQVIGDVGIRLGQSLAERTPREINEEQDRQHFQEKWSQR